MQCPNLGLQIQNHSQSLNDGLGDQVGSVVGVQPVTADNASTALIDIRALELKCQSWNDSGIWHFEE